MPHFIAALVGGVLLIGTIPDAAAQSFYGGMRGAVHDAAGVVPGVDLTLTNEDTGVARTSVTNDVGEYAFTAVVPGPYSLRAVLNGYKTFERQGLIVGTQDFLTIDVTLELGTVQEEITVTGASPVVERANASTGRTLDKTALDTLPSHARNPFTMAKSLPTVISSGFPIFDRQLDQNNGARLSVGGGPIRNNNYLLDGVSITSMRNVASAIPTIESLAEMKVQIHTYDAEMGRTGGGVFNATARSGTNTVHGSALYHDRPVWAMANDFFAERAGIPKPTDQYYRGYGGSVGGPIVKNHTFFWSATEGFRQNTAQTAQLFFPTARERSGDFSQTFDGDGNLIVIYDPLTTRVLPDGSVTRDPFPGNVIPPERLSAVARNMIGYFPMPDVDESAIGTGAPNYVRTLPAIDRGDMVTTKIEHKFSDRLSLTGTYLFNDTKESYGGTFWGRDNPADPANGVLHRKVNIVALNNTIVVNPTTVATIRYGWTRYDDNCEPFGSFDLASLGFPANFVNDVTFQAFPQGCIDGSECFGGPTPYLVRWSSWAVNGTVSKLLGRHTMKFGGDFRRIGMDNHIFDSASGYFAFDREWTQADPLQPSDTQGIGLASFLLGLPSANVGNPSQATIASPFQVFMNSYAGYIQDDVRVSDTLTMNLGLRYDYEAGLKEKEDRFTVAFDRSVDSPLAALTGLPLHGGLRYAGVDGAHDYQGDPSRFKFAPRLGAAWTLDPKTVIRGGYGLFWAPWNYPFPGPVDYGQIGYTERTFVVFPNQLVPSTSATLDDPFPGGLHPPIGNSNGLLTGTGGEINYVSQDRQSPRVQQFSFDLQRELPRHLAVSIGYTGTRGDHLRYGGADTARININQLPVSALALGPALQDEVPNPFYGIAEAGDLSLSPTVARGQLLRPFPQFGNIYERESSGARLRYHAITALLERRVAGGWGGRFHYTWSRRDDDIFGEGASFSSRASDLPQNSYDLAAEYGRSINDVPHRMILAPIVELPFGEGKRWATDGLANALFGGWTVAAIASYESGSPRAIAQESDNSGSFSGLQRPNLTGVDPQTPGSTVDRLDNYINPDAYAFAAPFTFGNAPRTDQRIRSPFRTNYDVSISKDTKVAGRVKAQIRFELLNLTNSPFFADGGDGVFGSSAFGTITSVAGYPRLLQLTFRAFW